MEEKIKVIQTKLEELKKKQALDDKNNNLEVEKNKEKISEVETQNKRLVSMRAVFSQEEEEYSNLSKEIEQNEAEVKKLESTNGRLATKGSEIREAKAYRKELEEIDSLKEELKNDLVARQKFLIMNRKMAQASIEERTIAINKEQIRLETDIEAIKRGIDKGLFLMDGSEELKQQQNRLMELETKYGENTTELERLSQIKGLEENDIYTEIDKITEMLKEIDQLTIENTEIEIELFEEEETEPKVESDKVQPTSQEEIEKNRIRLANEKLLQQYGMEESDILYELVMDATKENTEIGDLEEFAKNSLKIIEDMNQKKNTKGIFDQDIKKLKEEMKRAGIKYEEETKAVKSEEQDKKEEEQRRKQQEIERKKIEADKLLYTSYGIVKGDITYELVMEAVESNIPIGKISVFARQHLEELQKANEAGKGKYSKEIEKLEKEIEKIDNKNREEAAAEQQEILRKKEEKERAKREQEAKRKEAEEKAKKEEEKRKAEEQAKKDEKTRKEQQEILRKKEEKERIKREQEAKREEAKKRAKQEEEKRKVEEKARINNAIQKYCQDNIQAKGVEIARVPYIQSSIRKEMELGNTISDLGTFLKQRLAGLEQLNQQRDGRYASMIKALKKEMDLLGIEYDKTNTNIARPENRVEEIATPRQENERRLLVSLKVGKAVEFITKENGEYSTPKYGFRRQHEKDIFDEEFMYEAILDNELLKDFKISKGLKERLDPIVVKALMRIDKEYQTNGQYTAEYIDCMMTRGEKAMSFDIEYDLKELNGGKIKQILNKFKPNKNKAIKRQRTTIVETIQKHAMQSKYFGKKFAVKGKYDLFSKNKPKRGKIEFLPEILEEQQETPVPVQVQEPVQHDFRKSLRNPINDRIQAVASPTIKNAEFKKEQGQLDEELDDDFEIIDID